MLKLLSCVIFGLLVSQVTLANTVIELTKGVYFEEIVVRASDKASFVIKTQPYQLAHSDSVEKVLAEFSTRHNLSLQTEKLAFPDHLGNKTLFKRFSITLGRSSGEVKKLSKELLSKGIQVQEVLECTDCKHRKNQLISLVKVDPKLFEGRLVSSLANQSVVGLATVSKSNTVNNALMSINGNFFVMNSKLGLPGDISGIVVENGKLLSEAVDNRPALIVNNAKELKVSIAHNTRTKMLLHNDNDNDQLVIHGLNRLPNKILNCGNFENGEYQFPTHDVVCTNKDEVIAFTKEFGKFDILQQFDADIYILNKSLSKIDGYPTRISEHETLILATGKAKQQLKSFHDSSYNGQEITVDYHVFADDKELSLHEGMYIIGGGPTLLLDSKIPLNDWYKQGWHISSHKTAFEGQDTTDFESSNVLDRSSFYDSWVFGNHPRTSVGVDILGNVYFFTVYGRNSYLSQGMGLVELASLMESKGIVNAINLDGGGSTAMVVNGRLTGLPSDSVGERQVADVISIIEN